MNSRKAVTAAKWLFGTPLITGVGWIAVTIACDWLDGSRQGRPALMLGAMLTIPVVGVGLLIGIVGAIYTLSSKD